MENKISVINVKLQNRLAVFNTIRSNKNLTRNEIAEYSDISLATAATLLREFEEQQIIVQENENRKAVGRRPKRILFTPHKKKILAFDLSSKKFRYSLQDLVLKEYASHQHHYDKSETYQANLEKFLHRIRETVIRECTDLKDIIGVGISVPAPYDRLSDKIIDAPFPEIQGVPILEIVGRYFEYPVFIDHDVFLALQSEVTEIEQSSQKSIFYLHLGEGIGGALWSSNQVHRGAREDAGDIGQILIEPGITLDQKVSWNTFRSIFNQEEKITDSYIAEQYISGNEKLIDAVRRNTEILSDFIYKIFWITDPHVIIIAGHYTLLGESFLNLLKNSVSAKLTNTNSIGLELQFARYPFKASSYGAAEQVIQKWLKSF
jgi:predicted NBD/HSP70 family sugar kinase